MSAPVTPPFPYLSLGRLVVIKSTRVWWHLGLAEIWQFRDLLYLLVRRDFLSKYKQTILGPLWFVIQPLLTTAMFTVVFGHIAQISTDGVPAMLFYLNGLMGWNCFAQTFSMAATTFTTNASVFQKVYFPRLLVPLSVMISTSFTLGVQLMTFLAVYAYFYGHGAYSIAQPSFAWFWLPLISLQLSFLGLGCALWSSALTARYRDLSYLVPLLVQLWMYGTPIIYPMSAVPEAIRPWIALNPASAPIEALKYIFLKVGRIDLEMYSLSLGITLFIVLTGAFLFKRAEIIAADMA